MGLKTSKNIHCRAIFWFFPSVFVATLFFLSRHSFSVTTQFLCHEAIENFIRFKERDTNLIGEGLHNPVYGGKNSSVLRNGYEVLEKKNNQILKRARFYK